MADIYVDPEKVKNFAVQLSQFSKFVDQSVDRLNSSMSKLGESWRDQEFQAFLRETQQTQQRLKNFVQETEKILPVLKKDAEAMEVYQRLQIRT